MARNKDFAFAHHADMVTHSWTYSKMTKKEMDGWFEVAHNALEQGVITGTYDHRIKTLNALYYAYLTGLGYDNTTGWHTWRESVKTEPVPTF